MSPTDLRFEPAEIQESRPGEGAWEIDWDLSRGERKERAGHTREFRAANRGRPIWRPDGVADGIVLLRVSPLRLHQHLSLNG
jgi:hypothetical protein